VLLSDQKSIQDQLSRGIVPGDSVAALTEQANRLAAIPATIPLVTGQIAAQAALLKPIEDVNRAQEERNRIYEEGLLPSQRYDQELAQLNKLYPESERTATEYTRALTNLQDQFASMFDPTVRFRKEQENLKDAFDKGWLSADAYSRKLAELQAQQAMAETTARPGGVAQGIGAGTKMVAAEWQGMSKETADSTIKMLDSMQGAFTNFFENITKGTMTVGQAFRQLGNNLLISMLNTLAEMLSKWLITHLAMVLIHKGAAKAQAGAAGAANAAQAESAAFLAAAVAYAPLAWNPPAAVAAAAGAFAAEQANVVGAGTAAIAGIVGALKGGVVAQDMPVAVHAREMILPPDLSQHVQNMASLYGKSDSGRGAAISQTHQWNFNISGASDAQNISDEIFARVQRYFKTGGTMRK
jgi:hypothetical protein